jgi:hypothetical protein
VVLFHERFLEKVLFINFAIVDSCILCGLKKFGMLHFGECKVVHDRIVLSNYITESRNHSESRPFKFIQEMIKLTIELLFFVRFLEDSQLQFTGNCIFKEKIYKDVVVIII